jgi:hypothetical protein
MSEKGRTSKKAQSKNPAQTVGKGELSEQELDKASGGVGFTYGGLQIKYKPQDSKGVTP